MKIQEKICHRWYDSFIHFFDSLLFDGRNPRERTTMRTYRTIFPFLKKNYWHYIIGIVVLMAVDFANLLIPQIFRSFADLSTTGQLTEENLMALILRLLFIGGIMVVGRFIWRTQIFGTARRMDYWLRDKLFQKYLSLDTDYFNKNRTGDLMARATNDISAVRDSMGGGIMMVIDSLFMTIFTVVMMVSTAGLKTTAVALVSLPFLVIAVAKIIRPLNRRSRIVQDTFGELTTEVQENLSGIRVIKAFAIEDNRSHSFESINEKYSDKVMDLNWVDGLFDPMITLISGFSFFVFIIYGAKGVLSGTITVGSFVAIIQYLDLIIWPLIAMGLVISQFQRGVSSMERLNEIFRTQAKVHENEFATKLDDPKGKVEFKDVSFRYSSDSPWILKDVSFTLEPGHSLAILGRTGSGKSTLINLLLRRFDVTEGEILVDGVDIRNLTFDSLYRVFGVVAQESFLFSRPIDANIAFSSEEVNDDHVRRAAEFAQVDKDIEAMPQGYKSMVGERGVTLSGGQQQRVSIARAYYKNAPVLIMDDSLSAVDTETESRILAQLSQHKKGLIMVSQRISTVESLEEIIVIEDGRISQRGKHIDLVSQEGFYKELYQLQLLESQARHFGEEEIHV